MLPISNHLEDAVEQNEESPLLRRTNSDSTVMVVDEQKHSAFVIDLIVVGFLFSVAICGLNIVSYGENIEEIAVLVSQTSVEIGGIFLSRGFGSLIGCLLYPYLTSCISAMITMYISYIGAIAISTFLPFNKSVIVLYFLYFGIGLFISLINTGSVAMIRIIKGKDAGPWLSASIMLFSLFGMVSASIQTISSNIYFNFETVAIISFCSLLWLLLQPNVEAYYTKQLAEENKKHEIEEAEHYYVEILCASGLFCVVGCTAIPP